MPGSKGYLDLSRGVEILDRPTGPVNRSMGDVHPLGNPHYWLDPANAIRMAMLIEKKLEELDPANAEYYRTRFWPRSGSICRQARRLSALLGWRCW